MLISGVLDKAWELFAPLGVAMAVILVMAALVGGVWVAVRLESGLDSGHASQPPGAWYPLRAWRRPDDPRCMPSAEYPLPIPARYGAPDDNPPGEAG